MALADALAEAAPKEAKSNIAAEDVDEVEDSPMTDEQEQQEVQS